MDYAKNISGLFKQARENSQYQRFPSWVKVRMVIGLLPFFITLAILTITYYCINFLCKLTSAPADFLNSFLKQEGERVKHLTQAIMYWIAFPFIFAFKVMLSFLSIYMYVIWFFIMCLTYLVTLGSVDWQPYLFDANYDEERKPINYKPSIKGAETWAKIQIVLFIIYIIGILLQLIPFETKVAGYYDYYIANTTPVIVGRIFILVYEFITIISIISIFGKNQEINSSIIKARKYLNNTTIQKVTIPVSITEIGDFAFYGCTSLSKIFYDGTSEDWSLIKKGTQWNYGTPAKYVSCSNEDVML